MSRVCHGAKCAEAVPGKTLFDYADDLAVHVPTSCDRAGTCHECVVEVRRGIEALSPPSDAESFLKDAYRLACQAIVQETTCDVEFVPLRRRPQILTATSGKTPELDPAVTRRGYQVFYQDEPLDTFRGHMYGVAVDAGTTTVVIELTDLETGRSVYVSSFENPQRFGGSDVMHRISYDSGPFRGELHKSIINGLNHELKQMCRRLGFDRHEIYELVVAGNPTMRELFFGRDVQSIGQKPYRSEIEHEFRAGTRENTTLLEKAHRLGIWAHPQGRVYGAPFIASHVGADTAAALVAIDVEALHETFLLVDVGTNTEVVLGHAGRLVCASGPAGPAFEGGLVRYGMPGVDGAIESIRWDGDRFEYKTIGGGPPEGLCGSGLIDLLAELRRSGRMSARGVFPGGAREILIAPESGIVFSREDASNLAQAKSANYCAQYLLLRECGVSPSDVDRLYLAGGFANYVNVANALAIGFLPPVPGERIIKVGNASLEGAKHLLLSRRKRRAIEHLTRKIEHVELETVPDFFEVFVEGCLFQPM
ncbi:MAG: ASKHA domain-containing protein [Bryobacteraceae bacterium]